MRCPRHDLALAPDGTCIRCRRELLALRSTLRGSRILMQAAVLVVVGFAGLFVWRIGRWKLAQEGRVGEKAPSLGTNATSPLRDVPAEARTGAPAFPAPASDVSAMRAPAGEAQRRAEGRAGALTTRNSVGRSGAFYLPSTYERRALPLVVAIHGTGGRGADMVALFRSAAEREKFIVVGPDSNLTTSGVATWSVPDHPGDTSVDSEHIRRCVSEVRSMREVVVDETRVLVAGLSGGGSTAPYTASVDEPYSAFAVLHGGVFAGGLGGRRVRGWFSTGDSDALRPPPGVEAAAQQLRGAGFAQIEYRVFREGHVVGDEELRELLAWWLQR